MFSLRPRSGGDGPVLSVFGLRQPWRGPVRPTLTAYTEMTPRQELVALLEERTLPLWERRRRRLKRIGVHGLAEAIEKERKGLPLTLEEFVVASMGFLPDEYRAAMLEYESREAAERHEP